MKPLHLSRIRKQDLTYKVNIFIFAAGKRCLQALLEYQVSGSLPSGVKKFCKAFQLSFLSWTLQFAPIDRRNDHG